MFEHPDALSKLQHDIRHKAISIAMTCREISKVSQRFLSDLDLIRNDVLGIEQALNTYTNAVRRQKDGYE